jgi:lipoprotein-anchoring transpeptidase ErfK/SrfK
VVDQLLAQRTGVKADALRGAAEQKAAQISALQTQVQDANKKTDVPDTDQTIVVSTSENRLYVYRGKEQTFSAVCSTGKGTTLVVDGKTRVFDTPSGKFRIVSKEENPVWVPPDWHYVEAARKSGMRVVKLNRGDSISLGGARRDEGVWGWFGGDSGGPTLRVKGNTVVKDYGSYEEELPAGEMIYANGAIVIPPVGTPQRKFDKVLGHYRLNLGDGYALHGTQDTENLGQSVSHGCVRLGDADIEKLYAMAKVGDEVIIY